MNTVFLGKQLDQLEKEVRLSLRSIDLRAVQIEKSIRKEMAEFRVLLERLEGDE